MSTKEILQSSTVPIFPHMVRASDSKSSLFILADHKKTNEKMRDLSRFVLNNPSIETKQLVRQLFTQLGGIVKKYHLNAEDFNYLMEAVPEARSSFSLHHTPGLPERMRKLNALIDKLTNFDRVRDFDEHFARYAADIETLTSALGYRAIGSSVKKDAVIKPSENMKRLLADVGAYTVPHIGAKEFPHRSADDASRYYFSKIGVQIPQGEQDEVEEGLPGPQKVCTPRSFTLNSYVVKALSENIPMRAHVSGTASLTLASMQFVLNNGEKRHRPDEHTLMKLAGLLCATYDIGDFHSYAETAAGVAHFYQTYVDSVRFSNQNAKILEDIAPKTFYAMSFGFLNSLVSDRALERFNEKSEELLDLYIE